MTAVVSDDDDVDGRELIDGLGDALVVAMARGHLETRGVLTDEQTTQLRDLYHRRRRRTAHSGPARPAVAAV